MIIIPREEPVVQNLNSYFLKIDKLVEHYQGEVGTGSIFFKSPSSEAVIFFDEANLINSYYSDKKEELLGQNALTKIIEASSINNYSVSVFYIIPERLYFWANLAHAEVLYSDLNSEFTDVDGLIKKLEDEKHDGYIDVKLNQNEGGGTLYFFNGKFIGGTSAKEEGSLDRSVDYYKNIISKTHKVGGVFNVKKIQLNVKPIATPAAKPVPIPEPMPIKQTQPMPERKLESKPASKIERTPGVKSTATVVDAARRDVKRVLEMIEALLSLLERVIQSNRKLKIDFEGLLNKKFLEKANKYEFLDPFFDEFRYSNGRVEFTGKASADDLIAAVTECVREIVESLGIVTAFRKYLESWKKGFANEVIDFDIEI